MVRDNIDKGSCNDKGCNEWWCFPLGRICNPTALSISICNA
jgi:hypothetical protein